MELNDLNDTSSSSNHESELLLTERMRQVTRRIHDESDRLVNVKLGVILTSKALYAEAISLFWPVFGELESLMDELSKSHEQLKLLQPILEIIRRAPKFEQDIEFLLGSPSLAQHLMQQRQGQWMPQSSASSKHYSPPELQQYIDRLHHLATENPIVLLPYVYHMYSAILAGGAMIKRLVKLAYGLKSDHGVQIFILSQDPNLPNAQAVRKKLKHILDYEMKLSDEDKQLILQESMQVFRQNNALVATVKDTNSFAIAVRQLVLHIVGIAFALGAVSAAIVWRLGRDNK